MCETQVMEYQHGGILHAHTIGYVVKGFTNNNNEWRVAWVFSCVLNCSVGGKDMY